MFNYMLYIYDNAGNYKTHGTLERMSAELMAINYIRNYDAELVHVTDNTTGEILRTYQRG